jgi:membrane protease YdiL (CAAX protease family)
MKSKNRYDATPSWRTSPLIIIVAAFLILSIVEYAEFLVVRTDATFWGDNFIVKLFGIALLAWVAKRLGFTWGDLGFQQSGMFRGISAGLLLGFIAFSIAYGVEWLILAAQGHRVEFEVYVAGFSLTGQELQHTAFRFFGLNIMLNIINVVMEEGVFRGLFQNLAIRKYSFAKANVVVAAFFGFWHLVLPLRSYLDGEMSLVTAMVMGAGYVILAGLMSLKWGWWRNLTGLIWIGLAEHFFNNTVGNLLHVVTEAGVDELQTLRVIIAGMLSFFIALIVWKKYK